MKIAAASTDRPAAIRYRLNALADVDDKPTQWLPPAGVEGWSSWTGTRVPRNVHQCDSRAVAAKSASESAQSSLRCAGMSLRLQEICTARPNRIKRGPNLIQDIDFHDLTR